MSCSMHPSFTMNLARNSNNEEGWLEVLLLPVCLLRPMGVVCECNWQVQPERDIAMLRIATLHDSTYLLTVSFLGCMHVLQTVPSKQQAGEGRMMQSISTMIHYEGPRPGYAGYAWLCRPRWLARPGACGWCLT